MDPAPPLTPTPSPEMSRGSKRGCLIGAVVGGLLVIAALVGLVFLVINATKGVEEATSKFANAVVAGDKELAWSLTDTDFREESGRAELNALIDRVAPIVAGAKAEAQSRSISSATGRPSTGAVTYTVSGGQRRVYFLVNVIKRSGKWKVISFQSSETPLEIPSDTTVP